MNSAVNVCVVFVRSWVCLSPARIRGAEWLGCEETTVLRDRQTFPGQLHHRSVSVDVPGNHILDVRGKDGQVCVSLRFAWVYAFRLGERKLSVNGAPVVFLLGVRHWCLHVWRMLDCVTAFDKSLCRSLPNVETGKPPGECPGPASN